MQITEIKTLKSGRREIVLDNGTQFPLYVKEMYHYGLQTGTDLSEELLDEIYRDTVLKRAKKRLLYLLQRQERTESQLREKLRMDGYPQIIEDQAVAYVKQLHYVDDFRYACTYIRYHQDQKSRYILKNELRRRGIDADTIEEAFQTEYKADENELVRRLLEKKRYNPDTADWSEQRKIYAFLARKGFSPDVIRRGMRNPK